MIREVEEQVKAAGREVVTFPSRGYGHDRTMRLISAAILYSIYTYLLYHTPGMAGRAEEGM